MMVIYLPVKFEFDWTNRFRVRVRKRKCGRTDGRLTHQSNRRVGYTQHAEKSKCEDLDYYYYFVLYPDSDPLTAL